MIKSIEYRIAEYDDGKFNCQIKNRYTIGRDKSVQYTLEAAITWIENHKEPKVPKLVKIYDIAC